MTVGTTGFVAERLTQAREARGLSLTALADLLQVSSASISHYEKGSHTPSSEILRILTEKLSLPISFFLKPNPVLNSTARIFYRSMNSATKHARKRAERRFEWLKEIILYLEEFLEFPKNNMPQFDVPNNFRNITKSMIENYANQLRDYWGLGHGPIGDIVKTLETNGIFVSHGSLDAETLDAFSELDKNKFFYIFKFR